MRAKSKPQLRANAAAEGRRAAAIEDLKQGYEGAIADLQRQVASAEEQVEATEQRALAGYLATVARLAKAHLNSDDAWLIDQIRQVDGAIAPLLVAAREAKSGEVQRLHTRLIDAVHACAVAHARTRGLNVPQRVQAKWFLQDVSFANTVALAVSGHLLDGYTMCAAYDKRDDILGLEEESEVAFLSHEQLEAA